VCVFVGFVVYFYIYLFLFDLFSVSRDHLVPESLACVHRASLRQRKSEETMEAAILALTREEEG